MRHLHYLALPIAMMGGMAIAQSPEITYNWDGTPSTTKNWTIQDSLVLGSSYGKATISAATGYLTITETSTGTGNTVGGSVFIIENWNLPRQDAPAKGNQDVTGLTYYEVDIRHNNPTATVDLDFIALLGETDNWVVSSGTVWQIAPGLNTVRFPLTALSARQQASLKALYLVPAPHASLGNLTWTVSQARTLGTPLVYRDIVTNNAGTPDNGIDGAFPLNTSDMLAIVGNTGTVSQLGLSRNPAGSGSLQWTDKGGTGDIGSESGATIGWGSGAGWRNTTQVDQIGTPTNGNSYNERIADFSNYDRMTVRISAADALNPAGTVGIEASFMIMDPAGDGAPTSTMLPSQNVSTDGQYQELVYDLSSVSFLKNIWHWGLDVAPHANNIVFNIDNIRLWNSTTPQGVSGDYNGNGVVDAADYVVWRKGGALQNEGVTSGSNTPEDYTYWRSRYGANAASGLTASQVPEPFLSAHLFVLAILLLQSRTDAWFTNQILLIPLGRRTC